ncbi:Fidgetin-like protein 1 [Histomonas meleagridis]|uniref:Fidgetin-like protein 1 n=1 Tax=Histomonas meleagridis TaxID=135588 RepID=UPI00355AA144|nr:Fidgetin-like protein 1 [Histomonas meleagridis]KAH0797432.1 Fidgetin-like protein 1 [Histomonas meleagridis]
MKNLCTAIQKGEKGDKVDAIAECLLGIATLSENDKVSPLIFTSIIDSFGSCCKNIREMENCDFREVPPLPSLAEQVKHESIHQYAIAPKALPKEEKIPDSRLSSGANRFVSKNIERTAAPSFQTAASAMGIVSKKKDNENKQNEAQPPEEDERLRGVDKRLIEIIEQEILISTPNVKWDDVAGLEEAKSAVNEAIILPMHHPQYFTGLRKPPRGVLFFGPPGTGKTMIAKALATEAGCTFFNISASSLTSKWIGEGEKLTRALFCVARVKAPSIIFIDEIDSLLTKRTDTDFEASRRVKTEFLLQFEGVSSGSERILVLGATNRPQDLDDAARRRFTKRIYIPLPDEDTRKALIHLLLKQAPNTITDDEVAKIIEITDGYSCADISTLCHEAAMIPFRGLKFNQIKSESDVPPMTFDDIVKAAKSIHPSVSADSIRQYVEWNKEFGYTA